MMGIRTRGNIDDLFDDGVLGLLILLLVSGVLLIQRAQFAVDT